MDRTSRSLLAVIGCNCNLAGVIMSDDRTLEGSPGRPEDPITPGQIWTLISHAARVFRVVAVLSARPAFVARRATGQDRIWSVGLDGGQVLAPGGGEAELDPRLAACMPFVEGFKPRLRTWDTALLGMRADQDGPVLTLRWDGSWWERGAELIATRIEASARRAAFRTDRSIKALELRPAVDLNVDRGELVRRLITETNLQHWLYLGGSAGDLEAFRALDAKRKANELGHVVKVCVTYDDTPDELRQHADLVVEGARGVAELLEALLCLDLPMRPTKRSPGIPPTVPPAV